MYTLGKKILSIADNCPLQKMDDWHEFIIENKIIYLHEITYSVFSIMTQGKGSHLSLRELREVFNMNTHEDVERIFNIVNTKSKNISYTEFHDFISRGTTDDIYDIIVITKIFQQNNTRKNKYSTDVAQKKTDSSDRTKDRDDSSDRTKDRDDSSDRAQDGGDSSDRAQDRGDSSDRAQDRDDSSDRAQDGGDSSDRAQDGGESVDSIGSVFKRRFRKFVSWFWGSN